MLKYCRNKWFENKDKLEEAIKKNKTLNSCDYKTLVELVVQYILNPSSDEVFDKNSITVIDNGDYQGTQMFMIPKKTYQPNAGDYLLTYTWYGSCSGCDTLTAIQNYSWEEDKLLDEQQVKDFMTLCKDLVCNIVKPYNEGWYGDEDFTEVTEI